MATRPRRRRTTGCIDLKRAAGPVALALIIGATLIVAWKVWPAWDDGWLSLALRELGAGGIPKAYADRPLVAHAWAFLAAQHLLLPASAILLGASQLSLALAARDVWRRLFPSADQAGWLVAAIAAAPIVYTMTFVLVNPTWAGMLGPALAWPGVRAIHARRVVVGLPLIVLAALLSEYAFAATLAAALIYRDRRTTWIAVGVAIAGLGAYVLASSASARPSVRPGFLLGMLGGQIASLPLRLAGAIIYASAGALARDAAHVAFSIASIAGALAIAPLVGGARAARPDRRTIGALLLALAAGLGPALLAGREPGGGGASRYFLPVLPVAACLPVAIAGWLAPRIGPIVLGALVGATTAGAGAAVIAERPAPIAPPAGELVLGVVDPLLHRSERWTHQDYEWTARLTGGWPADDARRFWVVPDGEVARWVGTRDACVVRPFARSVRGVTREGRPSSVIWIGPNGIEPYCRP
jgi:hypothetical protein